jgi:hypothetical protein
VVPKIAIIGAGSRGFGKGFVEDLFDQRVTARPGVW